MQRLFKGLWRFQHSDWPSAAASSNAPTPDTAADRMETRLLTILAQVNDWLQFAEAKNAGQGRRLKFPARVRTRPRVNSTQLHVHRLGQTMYFTCLDRVRTARGGAGLL